MNSTTDQVRRKQLRYQSTNPTRKPHKAVELEKKGGTQNGVREIENAKVDSNTMYKAVRNLQRMKKKEPLVVQSGEEVTTDPDEQVTIVDYFSHRMFSLETEPEEPKAITSLFIEAEVRKAAKSLTERAQG